MTAAPVTPALADADPIGTPWFLARRRFRKNILAVVGGILVALILLACFASLPWSLPRYADQQQLRYTYHAPSAQFPLGTDRLGRDLLARFLLGGAISLTIGLVSAAIAVLIGTSVGLISGYVGGRLDALLMRIVDVVYGLPYILLVILMRVALVAPMSDPLPIKVTRSGSISGKRPMVIAFSKSI